MEHSILALFRPRAAALLLTTAAALPSAAQAQAISESFDDITTLTGAGWSLQNKSNPVGPTGWFQGDDTKFAAHSGAANAYIAADINNKAPLPFGTISNWLLMPNRTLRNGDVLTFYTRKTSPDLFGDSLEVRMSTNGASTSVGATATSVGDFSTLLTSINPSSVPGGYPTTWTLQTITVSGLPAPTSGRFAFHYFITATGRGEYIGIDDVAYTPYTCPAITVSGTPPAGYTGMAYSSTMSQTGALGTPSFAITSGTLPQGMTLSSAGAISGTPVYTGTFNFTVTATDNSGCSGSLARTIVVFLGKPPQPASAAATAGDTQAVVSWPAVWADPSGLGIASYTATAVEDSTKSCFVDDGAGSSCTVTGLTNGTSYTFAVVAHNYSSAYPDSDAAITNAVTPQGPQSISFTPDPIPPQHTGTTLTLGAPGQPVATATSGQPITYSATGNCSVAGSVVSFTGTGACTLTASQPGGGAWTAAAPVQRNFAVLAAVAPTAIPTLSQWALALLAALLGGLGIFRARSAHRVRRTSASSS